MAEGQEYGGMRGSSGESAVESRICQNRADTGHPSAWPGQTWATLPDTGHPRVVAGPDLGHPAKKGLLPWHPAGGPLGQLGYLLPRSERKAGQRSGGRLISDGRKRP